MGNSATSSCSKVYSVQLQNSAVSADDISACPVPRLLLCGSWLDGGVYIDAVARGGMVRDDQDESLCENGPLTMKCVV